MPYVTPPCDPPSARRTYSSDLSEADWLLIEPLLPVTRPRGQPRLHTYRDLVDAILYILRNGATWRGLPHDLPPWPTVYTYFRDWSLDGTWKRIHDALMEADRELAERAPQPSAGVLDSQTARTTEKGGIEATTAPSGWSDASVTSWSTPMAG
jgi:transposase